MKAKLVYVYIFINLVGATTHAQDSAMQAAPGSPPPPQGWTAQLPPDSGIHAPRRKKIKLQLKSADEKTPPVEPSPAP